MKVFFTVRGFTLLGISFSVKKSDNLFKRVSSSDSITINLGKLSYFIVGIRFREFYFILFFFDTCVFYWYWFITMVIHRLVDLCQEEDFELNSCHSLVSRKTIDPQPSPSTTLKIKGLGTCLLQEKFKVYGRDSNIDPRT